MHAISYKNYSVAFGIKRGAVISLVGGGGKTTLMFALAAELVLAGRTVVTTTTTKILEPGESQSPLLIVEADEKVLMKAFSRNIEKFKHVTLAAEKLANGKLRGISPQIIEKLAHSRKVDIIIVEADGAAGKPLKAPDATEPVIPPNTSIVIPVTGIDAVGSRLNPENVFRPEIVSGLLDLPAEEIISPKLIAVLLTHPLGIIKGTPPTARIIPFINKTDLDVEDVKAAGLAEEILKIRHPQIKRVILGQANKVGGFIRGIIRN